MLRDRRRPRVSAPPGIGTVLSTVPPNTLEGVLPIVNEQLHPYMLGAGPAPTPENRTSPQCRGGGLSPSRHGGSHRHSSAELSNSGSQWIPAAFSKARRAGRSKQSLESAVTGIHRNAQGAPSCPAESPMDATKPLTRPQDQKNQSLPELPWDQKQRWPRALVPPEAKRDSQQSVPAMAPGPTGRRPTARTTPASSCGDWRRGQSCSTAKLARPHRNPRLPRSLPPPTGGKKNTTPPGSPGSHAFSPQRRSPPPPPTASAGPPPPAPLRRTLASPRSSILSKTLLQNWRFVSPDAAALDRARANNLRRYREGK